jgi:hypothetical protein
MENKKLNFRNSWFLTIKELAKTFANWDLPFNNRVP